MKTFLLALYIRDAGIFLTLFFIQKNQTNHKGHFDILQLVFELPMGVMFSCRFNNIEFHQASQNGSRSASRLLM